MRGAPKAQRALARPARPIPGYPGAEITRVARDAPAPHGTAPTMRSGWLATSGSPPVVAGRARNAAT